MAKHDQTGSRSGTETHDWSIGSLPAQDSRDLTGRTLGDFEVERLLGRGGMGEVYLARQISLDRAAALKVLKPDLLTNATYKARFESEAWAAARLNHPNIVHIYTLGEIDGIRFIAMEYVPGTNLRDYITKRGAPELGLALSIMRQTGQALSAAGEVGLVHRDIKPDNLLLTKKGQVKVADFGLCRTPDAEKLNLTHHGTTLGTPMYMSPEQVQGLALDHRSDLYSMGVTFYHMLAGSPPFKAEQAMALAIKQVRETPTHLSVHRPDLPPDLCNLVMKLIAKDAADRFQSAGEMLRELARIKEAIQSANPVQSRTPSAPAAGLVSREIPAGVEGKRGFRVPRFNLEIGRRAWTTCALLGLVCGLGFGWITRADNLLKPDFRETRPLPGLWMAPWDAVAKQATPAAQYRFAQTRVTDAEREAAWLAVPGYFPTSAEWAYQSYTQYVRHLFRHRDAERLHQLSDELEAVSESGKNTANSERIQTLARFAQAAAAALEKKPADVLTAFQTNINLELIDPAVAELGLEIVAAAHQFATTSQMTAGLNRLRLSFQTASQIGPLLGAVAGPNGGG